MSDARTALERMFEAILAGMGISGEVTVTENGEGGHPPDRSSGPRWARKRGAGPSVYR